MDQSCKILLLLFSYLTIITSMNPPLWHQKFTIDFSAKISNLRANGKYWYYQVQNLEKIHFDNGNIPELCKTFLPQNTPCTLLTRNQTTYFIFPEKQLCCSNNTTQPIRRQDWLSEFNFKGQTMIQSELFYEWESQQGTLTYFEGQSAKRIPRREAYAHGRLEFDYLPETYSEQFDTEEVFGVPQYCQLKCEDFHPYEKENQKELNE